MENKEIVLINKLANFIAEAYQLLGALEFDYSNYKHEIVPYMDVTQDLLHEADTYFDDDQWDKAEEWLEKKLKYYRKQCAKEKIKKKVS